VILYLSSGFFSYFFLAFSGNFSYWFVECKTLFYDFVWWIFLLSFFIQKHFFIQKVPFCSWPSISLSKIDWVLELIDGGAWYQDQLKKILIISAQTKMLTSSFFSMIYEKYIKESIHKKCSKRKKRKTQENFNYAHTINHFKVNFSTARKKK
jgi:hypothetical protein